MPGSGETAQVDSSSLGMANMECKAAPEDLPGTPSGVEGAHPGGHSPAVLQAPAKPPAPRQIAAAEV